MLEPAKAKSAGLIDEVVPAGQLLEKAKEWVLSATDADIVKPWDQKGWKMPGGAPYHPAGFMTFVGASPWSTARRRASIQRPRRFCLRSTKARWCLSTLL